MAVHLVILGPPGAGKGTQAEQVARRHRVPKVSTGDILRDAVQKGTALGRRAGSVMGRGKLVPDEVIIDIVRERLAEADARHGFVLDGFPRTVPQARALDDDIMVGRGPLIVVDIVVPESELVRRLSARLVCERCGANADSAGSRSGTCSRCGGRLVQRSDDSEEVIRERLKVYISETQPLVEYYQTRPTFRSVNGSQTPERVTLDLLAAIESAASGQSTKGVTA